MANDPLFVVAERKNQSLLAFIILYQFGLVSGC